MDGTIKKEKRRSNAYPSITLEDAYKLTELIQKNSGYTFIKLEDIARIANKSVGNISTKVGSAVQYDLLELKSGTGYRPSELFKKIFKPLSQEEKNQSFIIAFKSPKLYDDLINRFENQPLPSEYILPNILERDYNVYDDAAKKAASIFIQNVEQLGLLNSENELSFGGNNQESNEVVDEEEEVSVKKEMPITRVEPLQSEQGLLKIEMGLTDAKKAVLYYPFNLTQFDIELMKMQISVLEKMVEFKGNKKTEDVESPV